MNCPNWFSLVTRRDEEPELWDRALQHHDSCALCREEALDAEPTLLFRQMAAPELGRADLDAIKQAVSTMRRTLPLTEAPESSAALSRGLGQGLGARSRRALCSPRVWLRAAALVAVLFGATWFEGSIFQSAPGSNEIGGEIAVTLPVADNTSPTTAQPEIPADLLAQDDVGFEELPLVEDADPSYGAIVEVVGQDISFVLVMPPLDV